MYVIRKLTEPCSRVGVKRRGREFEREGSYRLTDVEGFKLGILLPLSLIGGLKLYTVRTNRRALSMFGGTTILGEDSKEDLRAVVANLCVNKTLHRTDYPKIKLLPRKRPLPRNRRRFM